MKLSLSEIAEAVCGKLVQGSDAAIQGVVTDSRKDCRGAVFFALKGPNFDGRDFLSDVLARGAVAVVVSGAGPFKCPPLSPVIVVDDTLRALGALAAHVRAGFKKPLVAISGSVGKTTTKDMAASILAVSRRVLKTEGNKNNLIGLPMTLFGLDEGVEAAVVELGISEPGEMEKLVSICSPDVAVITNIGRGHLQGLGSLEGVALAKGALFRSVDEKGVKAVNLDDPWVVKLAGDMKRAVTYSLERKADVTVAKCAERGLDGLGVTYDIRGRSVNVRFASPGLANVINGAAAIAATLTLGVEHCEIEEGLGAFVPAKGRMEVLRLASITVLDDTYNANPESVASALRTLGKAEGRRVAVLGDMLELGPASKAEHREAGRVAGTLGIEVVVAIGSFAADLVEGAASAGVRGAYGFNSRQEAEASLSGILRQGDTVLVKGSRGMALEKTVEALKQGFSSATTGGGLS